MLDFSKTGPASPIYPRAMRATPPFVLAVVVVATAAASSAAQERATPKFLHPCKGGVLARGALCGSYEVFEDRAAKKGRRIRLNIVVLEATGERVADPIFFIAGGPGQAATTIAPGLARSWMRRNRDIVLVDQRGTGKSNPLHVRLPGSADDPRGYMRNMFDVEVFARARRELEKRADLTKYTTPIAADDLNEVRQALGYDKINLVGASYGTRASLVYIRRHPETVRSAILTGLAPIAFKNPLFHARAAQVGFEVLVAECKADPRYAIYHDLDVELKTVLERLEKSPARVPIKHPRTGEDVAVTLTRDRFAEAIRVLMYYMGGNRTVPLVIHRAFNGDFTSVVENCIRRNGGLRSALAFGMLMSVVGSEDIPRIQEEEIEPATAGTFLGSARVRQQMAAARIWPKGDVPDNYGDPVSGDTPILFISGTHDPVTPPRWGVEAARHFPNSLHIIVPAAHGTSARRIEQLKREFLAAGTVKNLDTSFVEDLKLPPLRLPKKRVIR
jgi:pimeloyl-ACP methyl ester carboxylesterase